MPGEGPECPEVLLGSPDEPFYDFNMRIYEQFKDANITNGWCAPGKYKQIILSKLIGKPQDLCVCISQSTIEAANHDAVAMILSVPPKTTTSLAPNPTTTSTTASPTTSFPPSTVEICPDFVLDPSRTIIETSSYVLKQEGPSSGVCADKNKIVWVIDGSAANLPSKCVCIESILPG